MSNATVIDRGGDEVGMAFHLVGGVAHSYPDAGMAQHGYVVASVTKGHGLFQVQPEMSDNGIYAPLLGVSFGGDVGKRGIPAPYFAMRNVGFYPFLLFLSDERGSWKISFRRAASASMGGILFTFSAS